MGVSDLNPHAFRPTLGAKQPKLWFGSHGSTPCLDRADQTLAHQSPAIRNNPTFHHIVAPT
ncbi:hypothetical protein H5410_028623 [Solanum commersonii]|uniref:Uncharacterized protein n=1 Tax=Solanum commersonii TaxID=4109 RepID=A0A9J5Z2G2_SOLCO|nr:hypothetical protein H5410_028623 [Solanum commersonii]